MFVRLHSKGRLATLARAAALCAVAVLAGCGGQGAGAGGSATDAGGTISQVIVLSDKSTLPASDASTSATITVLVKDASNNVVKSQVVNATTTDSGVSLIPAATPNLTDSSGQAKFTLQAVSGTAAKANRTITVVARAGSATGEVSIEWANTRLTIAGSTSVTQGVEAEYTVKVVDGANTGIADVDVNVAFDAGTVTPTVVRTRSGGIGTFRVNASTGTSGTITASANALNAKTSFPVSVLSSSQPFLFVEPGESARPSVDTDVPVRVRFQQEGNALAGRSIIVSTTRGVFAGVLSGPVVTLTTDAAGEVTATLRSSSAGAATLNAIIVPSQGEAALSTSRSIAFRSNIAAKVTLSADTAAIGTNPIGFSNSTNRLRAVVRDATDNPVSGVFVSFSANDPSGGRIEPGLGVTDDNGQVSASFVAGPASSGPQGVTVTALVVGTSISAQTSMTVAQEPLFVALGTGNSILVKDDTTYEMPWSAIVTDSNRNPVVGAQVTASLTAVSYFKGVWFYDVAWKPRRADDIQEPPTQCASEDLKNLSSGQPNDILDSGEDLNGNGVLDPGSPVAVQVTSAEGKTGADGLAKLSVIYPKSFARWVEVRLTVKIATPGSESQANRSFTLPVLAADVASKEIDPPNVGARLSQTQNGANGAKAASLIGPYGYDGTRSGVSPDSGLSFCTSKD